MGSRSIWGDLLLDRKELRKRWIMGTIQPELFYIPWKGKDKKIYIDVVTEDGEYCTGGEIQISFYGWNDWITSENGYSHYANFGNRIFEKNGQYPNPIPKENAAVQPDLRKINFEVEGAEIKENGIFSNSLLLVLKGKRIVISGLPVGSYYLGIGQKAPLWCIPDSVLYPNCYEGMPEFTGYTGEEHLFQINKNNRVTGLKVDTHYGYDYNESNPYYDEKYPSGYYDVKYVDPPLKDNILPVLVFEEKYQIYIKILQQSLKDNTYYTPYMLNRAACRSDYAISGAYCEIYNNKKMIDNGEVISQIIRNRVNHTSLYCRKKKNIIKCTKPPIFAANMFCPSDVIYFRENKEEKTLEITEQDYYNYRDRPSSFSYKEVEFKFDAPSVKLELCWLPLPDGVSHITECQREYIDSGNKGLAVKMYVEGEYKGYFMCGFHICGIPLHSRFQGEVKPWYQNGRLGCRFYRNYYIFNDGEPDPTNGLYNIIRMSEYPDAPRVLSPLSDFCQSTGASLDKYSIAAGNNWYNNDHGHTFITLFGNGINFTLFSRHDGTASWDHKSYCSNSETEFDNILNCKCLNETGGLDLTDHNCQTYYYLGDGLTKEDCGLILSSVWYRQDSIEITHSTGGD